MNRAAIRTLFALATLAVAGVLLWFLFGPVVGWLGGADLDRLDAKDRIAAVGTIRGQVATVLSAAFVAGGLYYTGRKFVLDRDKQYTDRFTGAVDQLGSADVTVRAGGLRALDRILHDSPRDRNPAPHGRREVLDLSGVSLPGADLAGFDLRHADLTAADLTGARLRGADLRGARLDRAVLRKSDVSEAQLADAKAVKAILA